MATNLEDWDVDFNRKTRVYHTKEPCKGKWFAEIFDGIARCYLCGEPLPQEILDVCLLGGLHIYEYTGSQKNICKQRWQDMTRGKRPEILDYVERKKHETDASGNR
jgi:hypothetical protein